MRIGMGQGLGALLGGVDAGDTADLQERLGGVLPIDPGVADWAGHLAGHDLGLAPFLGPGRAASTEVVEPIAQQGRADDPRLADAVGGIGVGDPVRCLVGIPSLLEGIVLRAISAQEQGVRVSQRLGAVLRLEVCHGVDSRVLGLGHGGRIVDVLGARRGWRATLQLAPRHPLVVGWTQVEGVGGDRSARRTQEDQGGGDGVEKGQLHGCPPLGKLKGLACDEASTYLKICQV